MKVKCTTEQWYCFTEGKEYEVLRKGYGKYYVNDDNGDQNELWNYECEVIDEATQESTQELTVEPTREFKVGDKVKIVRKHAIEDIANWVPEMDDTIGCHGVVIDINQKAVAVRLFGGYWWYPSESLELIEEAKQDEIKEEPVQCNEAFEDYSSYPHPVIVNAPLADFISYQQFIDAFDEDTCPSVTIRKYEVFIEVNDQSFMCYTKEREQEVMRALIILYGKLKEKD